MNNMDLIMPQYVEVGDQIDVGARFACVTDIVWDEDVTHYTFIFHGCEEPLTTRADVPVWVYQGV